MTDEQMELTIGNLLRFGVALAAIVVACGGVWYLAGTASSIVSYHRFHDEYRGLRQMGRLSSPERVILSGLLLLVATPVARVVFSLIAFWMEKDRAYLMITLGVLAVLLYSLASAW